MTIDAPQRENGNSATPTLSATNKYRTWEDECLPRLVVLDPRRPVALCVLWNLIETLPKYAPGLHEAPALAVIGNLRTPLGIGWFLRGLWKFNVSRVVIWGEDLTGTGDALLRLWREGPTDDHRIPGLGWKLDPLVPLDAINELRTLVTLVDLRDQRAAQSILPALDAAGCEPRAATRELPPVPVPEPATLPSRPSTIFIRGVDPGDAWQRVLHYLTRYGKPRGTRKSESVLHHFSVHALFPVPAVDDPERWFGISPVDASRYVDEVLQTSSPTTLDQHGRPVAILDYHYGERIQNWGGHNQLAEVVQRLRQSRETKRASISILQATDLELLEDAPCWSLITFAVIDDELHSSHVFRSHDMYGGWPNNVLAILTLHRRVATELGVGLGAVEVISQNAQVYSRHLSSIQEWLEGRKFSLAGSGRLTRYRPDPAGSFVFSVIEQDERRGVRAQLLAPSGDAVLWEAESHSPSVLIRWIVESMILEPQHVRYLGTQEERLHRALKNGEPYRQG